MKVYKKTNNYFSFFRKNAAGETILTSPKELYFSVKQNFESDEYVFQKKMTSGDIDMNKDGEWIISILPYDTENLAPGKYVCDVKVIDELGLQFIIVAPQVFEVLDVVTDR